MIILYGMVLILYFLLFFLALRKKTSLAGIVYDFCIKEKYSASKGPGKYCLFCIRKSGEKGIGKETSPPVLYE